MNKYELALVVSTKIDDDARAAAVDKAIIVLIRRLSAPLLCHKKYKYIELYP